jgi:hypothetical protein
MLGNERGTQPAPVQELPVASASGDGPGPKRPQAILGCRTCGTTLHVLLSPDPAVTETIRDFFGAHLHCDTMIDLSGAEGAALPEPVERPPRPLQRLARLMRHRSR